MQSSNEELIKRRAARKKLVDAWHDSKFEWNNGENPILSAIGNLYDSAAVPPPPATPVSDAAWLADQLAVTAHILEACAKPMHSYPETPWWYESMADGAMQRCSVAEELATTLSKQTWFSDSADGHLGNRVLRIVIPLKSEMEAIEFNLTAQVLRARGDEIPEAVWNKPFEKSRAAHAEDLKYLSVAVLIAERLKPSAVQVSALKPAAAAAHEQWNAACSHNPRWFAVQHEQAAYTWVKENFDDVVPLDSWRRYLRDARKTQAPNP